MNEESVLKDVELYYIKDIHSKRWSGVRFVGETADKIRAWAFLDRMQIVILNLLLRRRPRK